MTAVDGSPGWWRALARELDGRYEHSLFPYRRRLVVERPGTRVIGAFGFYTDRRTGQRFLTGGALRACYSLPRGPRFRVLREGTLRMWLRQFGYQDIAVDDARFDARYTVKGRPEPDVRAVLRVAADGLVDLADGFGSLSSDRTWILARFGVRTRPAGPELARWLDLLVRMAVGPLFGVAELLAIPGGEVRWTAEPGPPIVTVRVPTPVELSICDVGRSVRMVAHTSLAQRGPAFSLTVGKQPLPPSLPAAGQAALEPIAGAELRSDGTELTLQWPGVCANPDVLLGAAATLAALAVGAHGPYR